MNTEFPLLWHQKDSARCVQKPNLIGWASVFCNQIGTLVHGLVCTYG